MNGGAWSCINIECSNSVLMGRPEDLDERNILDSEKSLR